MCEVKSIDFVALKHEIKIKVVRRDSTLVLAGDRSKRRINSTD